jgi:hypothetical protein
MHRCRAVAKRLIDTCLLALLALHGVGCGSTSVTELTAPGAARCQATLQAIPTLPAAGGKVDVGVVTQRECGWTATSNSTWLQISPASGQGEASITLAGLANPQGRTRDGSISINGSPFSVTQAASPCTFTVSATDLTIPAEGRRVDLTVTTLAGCGWTASSPTDWITISPANSTATADITVTVGPNNAVSPRTATLTIAGQPVAVNQAGIPPTPPVVPSPSPAPEPSPSPAPEPPPPSPSPTTPVICIYTLDPVSRTVKSKGADDSVRVTTGATCPWTVVSDVPWVQIKGSASGTGSREVRYEVDRNRTGSPRVATITIGGATHLLIQSGNDD